MGFNDYLQLGIEVLALVAIGAGALNRWAVQNHKDRLAMFTAGAANAAGRVRLSLSELPPGVDASVARSVLVANAAGELVREFAETGAKISATPAKAEALIEAHLSPPSLSGLVQALVPAPLSAPL